MNFNCDSEVPAVGTGSTSKTNISVRKTNFLDLTISIYRGKFFVNLYDKRNDYNFDVINYPFLDGNIPKGQSYGIFISQSVLILSTLLYNK